MTTFVNIQRLVVAWYGIIAPTLDVRTKLPVPIQPELPLVQVLRSPGREDYVTTYPHVDIECFAADEGTLWDIVKITHDGIRDLGGHEVSGQLVDQTLTISDPSQVFWAADVQRSVAVYELQLRPNP